MTATGATVEQCEGHVLVTVFTRSGWLVYLVNPDSGLRTVVERVEVGALTAH